MAVRKIETIRAAWGAGLLLAPRPVLQHLQRVKVDPTSVKVARVLGVRQLAQALLSGVQPSPEVLAMGVWVDLAHASSALALATLDSSRAFAGWSNAGASVLWAAWGHHDLHTGPVTDPGRERGRDALARVALRTMPGGAPLLEAAQRRRSQLTQRSR